MCMRIMETTVGFMGIGLASGNIFKEGSYRTELLIVSGSLYSYRDHKNIEPSCLCFRISPYFLR